MCFYEDLSSGWPYRCVPLAFGSWRGCLRRRVTSAWRPSCPLPAAAPAVEHLQQAILTAARDPALGGVPAQRGQLDLVRNGYLQVFGHISHPYFVSTQSSGLPFCLAWRARRSR